MEEKTKRKMTLKLYNRLKGEKVLGYLDSYNLRKQGISLPLPDEFLTKKQTKLMEIISGGKYYASGEFTYSMDFKISSVMLFRHIKDLESRGLIEFKEETPKYKNTKFIFRITQEGKRILKQWGEIYGNA